MPALEIMPQCATMEEAQRRANIERGLPYDHAHHGSTSTSSSSSTQRRETVTNDHSTQSPKASPGRLVRFVKRNLRGLRRRSYPPYDESDKQEKTTDSRSTSRPGAADGGKTKFSIVESGVREVKSKTPQHLGKGGAAKEDFSPIGVKYWPKIMEDEEEEPPEALQFDAWST